ncbi:MAG: hypothetical protein ACHQAY_05350 [Hyphomicrobiales bacterium]
MRDGADLATASRLEAIAAATASSQDAEFLWRLSVDKLPVAERERRRNAEIRAARRELYPGMSTSAASRALECDWRRYVAAAWPGEQLNHHAADLPSSSKRLTLRRLTCLNGGSALGWRRIFQIFEIAAK